MKLSKNKNIDKLKFKKNQQIKKKTLKCRKIIKLIKL